MKKMTVAAVALTAALMTGGVGATAHADPGGVPKKPTASGSAVEDGVHSGGVGPMVVDYPGGGTWDHDWRSDGLLKGCYSNYIHPTKYHSSAVTIGGHTDKQFANAGWWSNAYRNNGWLYTCYTYWATY